MDIETLKKWQEYKKWVEEKNKPIMEWITKTNENEWKRYEAEKKIAKQQEIEREQKIKRSRKALEKWEALPWYKKLKTIKPPELSLDEVRAWRRYYPYMPMLTPYIGLTTATWEGFLNWLTEEDMPKKHSF